MFRKHTSLFYRSLSNEPNLRVVLRWLFYASTFLALHANIRLAPKNFRDKHASLFFRIVSDSKKSFITSAPGSAPCRGSANGRFCPFGWFVAETKNGLIMGCHGVSNRETLLKGKDQYGWPTCTNTLRWAHIFVWNFFTFLAEQETIVITSVDLNCKIHLPLTDFHGSALHIFFYQFLVTKIRIRVKFV
jgi:hypothetical protein